MMRFTLPSRSSAWFALASLSVVGCAALVAMNRKKRSRSVSDDLPEYIAIAFVGNSMLYFNDCPRLVQQMLEEVVAVVTQDSCLRGGATLTSLWKTGNGMSKKFATEQAIFPQSCSVDERKKQKRAAAATAVVGRPVYDIGAESVEQLLQAESWDFVVLNDYTQGPARPESRMATETILREKYAPLLRKMNAIPVIVQTPAYRKPGIKDSEDLGDFETFTDTLAHGVRSYADTLTVSGIPDCRIAPVGEAYRYLYRNNPDLWKKLYSWDDFHPSPYGTWLQACVIYSTCFHRRLPPPPPPLYNALWWERSRYMQPPDEKPLPLPTEAEAMELQRVACLVCGVVQQSSCATTGKEEDPAGFATLGAASE
jgi:hypothetical protein